MGGSGSMTKWVEEEPVLANKDYTHFNFRGSKKVSDLLYKQLDAAYQNYKVLRKNRKIDSDVEPEIVDTINAKTSNSDE